MKKLGSLGLAADFRNHPSGYLLFQLAELEPESVGGQFDLPPLRDDNGTIYLPSNDAPGYRVALTGSSDQLKRLGNALTAAARSLERTGGEDDSSTDG